MTIIYQPVCTDWLPLEPGISNEASTQLYRAVPLGALPSQRSDVRSASHVKPGPFQKHRPNFTISSGAGIGRRHVTTWRGVRL